MSPEETYKKFKAFRKSLDGSMVGAKHSEVLDAAEWALHARIPRGPEKDFKRKPTWENTEREFVYVCPICDNVLEFPDFELYDCFRDMVCDSCGQVIDWEGVK